MTELRIYAASLADYNNGRLHGRWIDADQDADGIAADIAAMLAESPTPHAEEWAIHDYEGFGPVRIGEHVPVEQIATLAAGIDEHGPAFAAWVNNVGDIDEAADNFEDAYQGDWYESLAEYAEQLVDEGIFGHIDEAARRYFNFEALARDLAAEGYWRCPDTGAVFCPC